jgi:lauroyl/myristoyl acyltransferase
MNKLFDFIKRNTIWLGLAALALYLISPGSPELTTILFVITIEAIAIGLSGIAAYTYTQIDFIKENLNNNLGMIFLGVHVCVGLVILGVYIAQFSY